MFDTPAEMYAREAEIVTEEFLLRDDVYNLRRGGSGGFEYINKIGKQGFSDTEVAKKARGITREILIQKYGSISEFSKKCANSDAAKIKRKNTRKERNITSSPIHAQTPEANAKRIKTMHENGHQVGQKNSQYGKMWITDGVQSRSVFKTDLIPEGWRKGRVLISNNR